MKKSRIAKLALMGASITALAATLTTSTYAWYVSNKQADVKGGTGTTGAAGSDGSVLVSWTGGDGEVWFKEINFADDADKVANALAPIHYDSTGTAGFYGITDTGTKGAVSTDYIQFVVHIKTGSNATVTPKFNLSVTGSTTQPAYVEDTAYVTPKDAYNANVTYYKQTGAYATKTLTTETYVANKYYTLVNDVYTLATGAFDDKATYYEYAVSYVEPEGTDADPKATSATYTNFYVKCENCLPTSVEKGKNFSVSPIKSIWVQQSVTDKDGANTSYYCQDTETAGGDAHAYYQAVTGYTPWAKDTEKSGLNTIGTVANTEYAITYTIYLDGGDLDCYNSNAGYSIAFDLQFTI